ncbi:MAG: hypothetical protein A2Y14_05015 [Verrucomicrobia bacterium GWF2_51_19]|nr:MAG: hypothetical protein A2Y14_05015 [Verrucomicrobia bacterium GWF2_51_19]
MKHKQKAAFTLVEVLVGIGLFSIMSLGILMSLFFLQKDSLASFYRARANVLATSYFNQIVNRPYADLDPSSITLVKNIISLDGRTFSTLADLPIDGTYVYTTVDSRNTGTADMNFGMALTIQASSGTDFTDFLEIRLNYRWKDPFFLSTEQDSWPHASLTAIKHKSQ